MKNLDLYLKIWEGTNKPTGNKCWINWSKFSNGYGRVKINGKTYTTHRLIVSLILNLDYNNKSWQACHICNNKSCCNPLHIYVGTQSDNIKDTVKDNIHYEARKTHCINGHEYNKENTRLDKYNKRHCKICAIIYRYNGPYRKAQNV